jgi:3',5'-nucleoside bisphosphate phosphatase
VVEPKGVLQTYRAEFHLHTVLSPCAAVEMIPPLIIEEAKSKNINLIAITDHNSIDNVQAVIEAAKGSGITVLPGIELQTREEIHSLCLFDLFDQAYQFFDSIRNTFPDIRNNSDYFGEQFVVDATGEFIRREERLLISSSSVSLSEAWEKVTDCGGLFIPSHVNRTAFGLLPVLGMIPTDIDLQILEISRHLSFKQAIDEYPQLSNYALIQGGDAHTLQDIEGWNQLTLLKPSIAEIKLAMNGQHGRSYKNLNQPLDS